MAAVAFAFGVIIAISFVQLEASAQETTQTGCLLFANRSADWCSASNTRRDIVVGNVGHDCHGTFKAVMVTNPEVCDSLTTSYNLECIIQFHLLHDFLKFLLELSSAYVAILVVLSWCHEHENKKPDCRKHQRHKKDGAKRKIGFFHFKVLYQCAPCLRRVFAILATTGVLLNISSVVLTCIIEHIAESDFKKMNCVREYHGTSKSTREAISRITAIFTTMVVIKAIKCLYSMLALFLVWWKFWKHESQLASSKKSGCFCQASKQQQVAVNNNKIFQITEKTLLVVSAGYLCTSFTELCVILYQRSGMQSVDLFSATRAVHQGWCHYCTCGDGSNPENTQQTIMLTKLDIFVVSLAGLCLIAMLAWPLLPMRNVDSWQQRQIRNRQSKKSPSAEESVSSSSDNTVAASENIGVASQNSDGSRDVYVENSMYSLSNLRCSYV